MGDSLLIRADASSVVGTGHVFRCLALAQAWQDRGGRVVFAAAELPASLRDRLESEQCGVEGIPAIAGSLEDAAITAQLARGLGATWVVLDGYHLGGAYRQRLRAEGHRVLLLDDDGSRGPYDVDAVLNQNLGARSGLYAGVSSRTGLLVGSHLALLRREFRCPAVPRVEGRGLEMRVLVSFGGADPVDLTGRVLRALTEVPVPGVSARLLVGPANPRIHALEEAAVRSGGQVEVMPAVTDMSAQLAWADVALVGAGSTCWELCHRGVPALLVSLADNQRPIARAMTTAGAGRDLGWHAELTSSTLRDAIREMVGQPEVRERMARAGRRAVDGCGAVRVATYLHGFGRDLRGALRISVVCAAPSSWFHSHAQALCARLQEWGGVQLRGSGEDVPVGEDLTFWLGGEELAIRGLLGRSRHNLLLQGFVRPNGRCVDLFNGPAFAASDVLSVSLEEVVETVGTGAVYREAAVHRPEPGSPQSRETRMASTIVDLCENFVRRYPQSLVEGRAQALG